MVYQPTVYRDYDPETPLSAANLNKSEQGIKEAHDLVTNMERGLQDRISTAVNRAMESHPGIDQQELSTAVEREVTKQLASQPAPEVPNLDELIDAKVKEAVSNLSQPQDLTEQISQVVQTMLAQAKSELVTEARLQEIVASTVQAAIAELPKTGMSEEEIRALLKRLPQWGWGAAGKPGPEHDELPEGSFVYTQADGRVFRKENGEWKYKGFNSQAVTDNQVAFQILNGALTRAALAEVTGIPIPYSNDYNQPRISFAGREWVARDSSWKSGGPNAGDQWAAANVAVDRGKVTLKLTNEGTSPVGAELVSVQSMGYGTYEVEFDAPLSTFDKHTVFGAFTFDWADDVPGHGELDMVEISKWGKAALAAKLTHYPDQDPVHSPEFAWPETVTKGIIRMVWEPGKITWTLINATTKEPLHTASTADRVPTPRQNQVHINLWAFNADGWQTANPVTVTLTNFTYTRMIVSSQAPGTPAPAVPVEVPALQKYFQPGKRYMAPVTYWWPDEHWNAESNWKLVFEHPDLVPFVILNISSGAGSKQEPDAVKFLAKCRANSIPVVGYVRTVTDLGQRTMRPTEDIKNEVKKFREYYGDSIAGVFYDEAPGGWDAKSAGQIPIYKELHDWAKTEYGTGFLVVANPGSPTKEGLLECADVLMTFEQAPERYFSGDSNLVPDWYKTQPAYRFWHVLHDVKDEAEARKVLDKAAQSNVATIYLTDDTFSGVIGSESESNNPWDRRPAKWLEKLQTDWCRRVLADPVTPTIPVFKLTQSASHLPFGTFYVLDDKAPGDSTPSTITVVASNSGNLNATELPITLDGAKPGDKVIIAVNTKANGVNTISAPRGFTTLMDGYYVGTQKSWIFTGDYTDTITITGTTETEYGYAAAAIRGATSITAGTPKDRKHEPLESTTVTAPRADSAPGDVVLGIGFERTSATETSDQVTLSEGWKKIAYAEQDANYQTVMLARGGSGDLTITYPNSQSANGVGVQVVCHA